MSPAIQFHYRHLSPPRVPHQHASHDAHRHCSRTDDSHTIQPLSLHLIINQAPQALRLQIPRLDVQQTVIIPLRLAKVAQFVVPQPQIVQALSPPLRACAVDFGEQSHAFLLLGAQVRFDQAPGVVELRLEADEGAFLLVLGAQDAEFFGLQGTGGDGSAIQMLKA